MTRGLSIRLTARQREALAGILCVLPWVIGFLTLTLGPILYSLGLSLFKADILTPATFIGFENYRKLLTSDVWQRSLLNTVYYTLPSVALSMLIGLLIAILLNQKVKFLAVFRLVYYLPCVISGAATALIWDWLLHTDYGLVNGFLRLFGVRGPSWLTSEEWAMPAFIMMGLWGAGGGMVIFLAGLQGIPRALYDAAKIDGAGTWRCFLSITLPMITPTIFFNLITGIIGSFQVFTPVYMLTSGGPNNATLTQVLLIYREAFQGFRFGYASAVAWVLFLVILVFTAFFYRWSEAYVYYAGELAR
jgi:multiple sugar transport system permease protein